jgi:hypothetical protein
MNYSKKGRTRPESSAAPLDRDTSADRPWERLDAALADALGPVLPDLADEIVAEIAREIPGYRRPIEGTFGRGLRAGVREALGQFVALVGRPGGGPPSDGGVYRGLGRGELRAGRSLDALQAAYRLGARIAWRRVSAAARAAGADADQMSLLAESIFAYIDEISSQSVEGYAQAQAAVAGERQRRRERLVRLMVAAEERPQEDALVAAAAEAGWPLPRELAALVADGEDGARLAGRLAPDAIAARVGELTCVLLPDPAAPGLRAALVRAAEATAAALGPAVAPLEARLSYARARAALRLHRRGVLPGGGLIVAEQHLGALLLFRDARLLGELAEQRLGPLAALAPAARERLEQTLLSWLRHQGGVPAVALELHVHRQTVRYRLARLRELLGDGLDEPDARLELELALRGRALRPAGSQTMGPVAAGPAEVDAHVAKP